MATIATANASAAVTGAGSSLVAPLMANWINGFEIKEGIKVTYASVGSGTGIAQITARTVDFGASDAPLTPEQAA
ncbi:MAG TPA: substrate-binding domain-containing protein, partial [Polyangia bacterium]